MRRLITAIAAVLAVLAFATSPTTVDTAPAATVTASPIDCAQWVSGTIRWTSPTTWATVDDTAHRSTGIAAVVLYPDHLRVDYTFTATTVSSLQVTPDEAFTSAGVRFGASVGLDHADIYAYMPAYGTTPVNPALLTKAGANVWLTGLFDTCPTPAATP